jgi:hypothetical protein
MFADEDGTGKIIVHLEDANRTKFRKELEMIIADKAGSSNATMKQVSQDTDDHCYVRDRSHSLAFVLAHNVPSIYRHLLLQFP